MQRGVLIMSRRGLEESIWAHALKGQARIAGMRALARHRGDYPRQAEIWCHIQRPQMVSVAFVMATCEENLLYSWVVERTAGGLPSREIHAVTYLMRRSRLGDRVQEGKYIISVIWASTVKACRCLAGARYILTLRIASNRGNLHYACYHHASKRLCFVFKH